MSRFLWLLILTIFIPGCGTQKAKEESSDTRFTTYISAYTSGVISSGTEIRVRLREDLHPDMEHPEEARKLFSFEPGIDGKTHWEDARTLVFTPDARWKNGDTYHCSFSLDELYADIPGELSDFQFNFKVRRQGMSLQIENVEPDPQDDTKQTMHGVLRTNDFVESKMIEEQFKAKQSNADLSVSWVHENGGCTHTFSVSGIQREKETEGQVEFFMAGSALGIETDLMEEVEVAALNQFKLLKYHSTTTPEQCVTLIFSDPLDEKQDLQGLVELGNAKGLRFEVVSNTLKVYTSSKLDGIQHVVVHAGVKNRLGYSLQVEERRTITFVNLKPEVQLVGDGVITPNTDGAQLAFKAVNLRAVKVRIVQVYESNMGQFLQVNQLDNNRQLRRVGRLVHDEVVSLESKTNNLGIWQSFGLDLSKMIEQEPGALYRVQLLFDQSMANYPCEGTEENMESTLTSTADWDTPQDDWYYDDYDYYDYYDYEIYEYEERDNPCHPSYYMRSNRFPSQNIVVSDLGLVAKGGDDGAYDFFVSSLSGVDLLSGVDVVLYNYQQQEIARGQTNSEGMVSLSAKGKPFYAVASRNKEKGYLKMDQGSALSLSMFDVDGERNEKGLKGFIYGDRGVWRPGDSLYLSFILEDKAEVLPAHHPVKMELYTPEGQLYSRTVQTEHVGGLYDFRTVTDAEAPTGNWRAKIRVGNAQFTKRLKIEAVKPNRLKIDLNFNDVMSYNGQVGDIHVEWLTGAPAPNLKAEIDMSVTPAKTRFKGFDGYTFDDPTRYFSSYENRIFEKQTDGQGDAVVDPEIKSRKSTPGMLTVTMKTKAYEPGGDFSVDQQQFKYSPYSRYVGVDVPKGEGWRGALYAQQKYQVPVALVEETGEKVSTANLKFRVYKLRWRWWWENDKNEFRYANRSSQDLIQEGTVSIDQGKGMFTLNVEESYWGRVLIEVEDASSGHKTGEVVYMRTPYGNAAGLAGSSAAAEMLMLQTDKETYGISEEVKVTVPVSAEGKVLLTLEAEGKVLKKEWLQATGGQLEYRFVTTPDMSPNIYVHASLIQAHQHNSNDRPIRMYGVIPVEVVNPMTHLKPVLQVPEEWKPEEHCSFTVAEADGKSMNYTVAVVDEGLLALTNHKTPDPWNHFYKKSALRVNTWDMYKYVMGSMTGSWTGLFEIGGDEFVNPSDKKNANRFKPVVKFFGPFHLDAGAKRKHEFEMPNYVGAVRVMIVASENGNYGKQEEAVPVRKPFMLLSTLPRVLGPGEQVKLPVTVFAMKENVKNAKIKVISDDKVNVLGASTRSLTFESVGDKTVDFELEVGKEIGITKLRIEAESNGERIYEELSLDIRVPNPMLKKQEVVELQANGSKDFEYVPLGVSGTNKFRIEISTTPALNLEERLSYLIQYPHGCVEQTTSSVFPQLFLDRFVQLSSAEQTEIQNNIQQGLNRLKKFQLPDGGMSYWPGGDYPSEWGTNYAGHFMLEAKARGFDLPYGMLDRWVACQTDEANSWRESRGRYYRFRALPQAYRLYTLALAGKPAWGAMNRLREIERMSVTARCLLAGAYVLGGKKDAGMKLVEGMDPRVPDYKELSHSFGSSTRDLAMILDVMQLMGKRTEGRQLAKIIAERLGKDHWMSTQTTAYALLAMGKFYKDADPQAEFNVSYTVGGQKENFNTNARIHTVTVDADEAQGIQVRNNNEGSLFVSFIAEGSPVEPVSTKAEESLYLSVKYKDLNGKVIDPKSLKQGSNFVAELTVTHPGIGSDYEEMALSAIFPSGWQLSNPRMDLSTTRDYGAKSTYQDFRDDRVYTYFNLRSGKRKTFKVYLNATFAGTYCLPAISCEAMYDASIHAHVPGGTVEVTK